MDTGYRPTWRRWAILAAKILATAAAIALVAAIGLVVYVGHEIGDPFKTGRMWGGVGDASLRYEYGQRWVPTPLVTKSQVAAIHPGMPVKTVFRQLGGRAQKIPTSTRIKGHWVHTATSYDYPIAGSGHLCHGQTVADEAEITISTRTDTVLTITQRPWRTVCRQGW
jgi:hypothetical protein